MFKNKVIKNGILLLPIIPGRAIGLSNLEKILIKVVVLMLSKPFKMLEILSGAKVPELMVNLDLISGYETRNKILLVVL